MAPPDRRDRLLDELADVKAVIRHITKTLTDLVDRRDTLQAEIDAIDTPQE